MAISCEDGALLYYAVVILCEYCFIILCCGFTCEYGALIYHAEVISREHSALLYYAVVFLM